MFLWFFFSFLGIARHLFSSFSPMESTPLVRRSGFMFWLFSSFFEQPPCKGTPTPSAPRGCMSPPSSSLYFLAFKAFIGAPPPKQRRCSGYKIFPGSPPRGRSSSYGNRSLRPLTSASAPLPPLGISVDLFHVFTDRASHSLFPLFFRLNVP